jgi:hypothetical protein
VPGTLVQILAIDATLWLAAVFVVLLEDCISEWDAKGEILDGYFNPDGGFDTVTVLGLVEDQPADATVARLCAPARPRYLNAEINRLGLMLASLGLRPGRLASSLARGIDCGDACWCHRFIRRCGTPDRSWRCLRPSATIFRPTSQRVRSWSRTLWALARPDHQHAVRCADARTLVGSPDAGP